MNRCFRATLLFSCLYIKTCFSQSLFSDIKYQLEAGTYFSSSKATPFWQRTNQYGIVPLQSPILTFRGAAHKEYDSTRNEQQKLKNFGIGYGFWGVANIGNQSKIFMPESYIKIRHRAVELYGGRRREIIGLVDTTLTAGSYIWSGNALPIPKIQLAIPNYSQIGKSSFFLKLGISHGWFGKQRGVTNSFLHQKWFYGRLGREDAKFKFYAGFNHQVQWGGVSENKDPFFSKDGQLAPYPKYSYQFVLIPFLQKLIKLNPDKLTTFDRGLAIGNHLGSVDIGLEFENTNVKLLFYKQQPYDFARSLYNFNNIEDGLYGLSLNLKQHYYVKKILIEYLYTVSQGLYRFGKYQTSNYIENDDYFSHGQYTAWEYNNFIIGTPFILANESGIYNNRIKAFSTYINGSLFKQTSYILGGTFSSNLGTYASKLSKNQFSGKANINHSLKNNTSLLGQVTLDIGTLYSKNIGFSLIYRKLL